MVKKNIVGIIMIIFIAAAFVIGYQMGKSSSGGNGGSAGGPSFGPPGGGPPSGMMSGKAPNGGGSASGMKSGKTPDAGAPASGMMSGKAPDGEGPPSGMMSGKRPGGKPPGGKSGKSVAPDIASDSQSAKQASISPVREEQSLHVQTFYGTVIPFDEAKIQSEKGGTIEYLKYKAGDSVKKGEVLVRFDNSDKLLELEKQESSRNSLQQKVEQAVSNYNTVKRDYERNKNLFDEGLVSKQTLDNMTHQLQAALTSLQNSKESVSQAETQLRIIANDLKDFQITASISGVVESKEYNLQEVYKSGDVIYNIINIDQIYAEIEVPETYLPKVKEGMAVPLYFSALGDRKFSGILETILPSGSDDNRNFTAKVIVDNSDFSIKPGMFARVDVTE